MNVYIVLIIVSYNIVENNIDSHKGGADMENQIPTITGELRSHFLMIPQTVWKASGIPLRRSR